MVNTFHPTPSRWTAARPLDVRKDKVLDIKRQWNLSAVFYDIETT